MTTRLTPVKSYKITPHGGYGVIRWTAADGACGVKSHPCSHLGVDLGAPAGTPVRAPINSVVVATGDGESPPFTGYGPYVVLLLGEDGYYQLIAHMARGMPLSKGRVLQAGQLIGTVSTANHVHYEVRRGPSPSDPKLDPFAWLDGSLDASRAPKYVAMLAIGALGYYGYRTWKRRGGQWPSFTLR